MHHHLIGGFVAATALAVLGHHTVGAQQADALERVKAANEAFYEAASARDLAQMDAVWAHERYVRVIHPTNQRVDVGWEAVRASWEKLFSHYVEISVAMAEPHVRVGDRIAWVTGEEQFQGRPSSGEQISTTLLGTSVFERSGDEWLMVHHHVSVPPPAPQ